MVEDGSLYNGPLQVEYEFPERVEEAIKLKQEFGNRARFIAGGTDLLLLLEQQKYRPDLLIDVSRIPSLRKIETSDGQVLIGSGVTYSQLLTSPTFTHAVPFLADAIRTIGGTQIRNVATLVGNITNASPAGDTLAPLYVLNSRVHLLGPQGSHTVPIEDFILGVRQTALNDEELVTHVSFDIPNQDWRGVFEKLGIRRAMAIAVVSVSALLRIEQSHVVEARIALGAVGPTIIRAFEVEAFLEGLSLNSNTIIEEASSLAGKSAKPIDDIRASAQYRRLAVQGLIRRALRKIQKIDEA
jgi:CO/xanthine dehydrogenase FAD-binding subunit